MTDAQRRRLILLAEARGNAISAGSTLYRLVMILEQLRDKDLSPDDPLYAPSRVAKDLMGSLADLRQRLTDLISEIPL